jgi:hypothetical protein
LAGKLITGAHCLVTRQHHLGHIHERSFRSRVCSSPLSQVDFVKQREVHYSAGLDGLCSTASLCGGGHVKGGSAQRANSCDQYEPALQFIVPSLRSLVSITAFTQAHLPCWLLGSTMLNFRGGANESGAAYSNKTLVNNWSVDSPPRPGSETQVLGQMLHCPHAPAGMKTGLFLATRR